MHNSENRNILPLRSCPRIEGLEYVLIIDNHREPGVAMPVLATCERYKTGVLFFFCEDWRVPEGIVDECKIWGWLDYRGEAISGGELAMTEVAELTKTVHELKRQVESLRQGEVGAPIGALRKQEKKVPIARGVSNDKRKTVAMGCTRALAPSKGEARMLKKIFLDATS